MDAKDKIELVNRYVKAVGKPDDGTIRSLYADNATLEDPAGSEPIVGVDAIVEFYNTAATANVEITLTGNPRCAGNYVAFPFTVKASGMAFEAIDLFEFNDEGKIISMKAIWGEDNMLT